MRVRICIGRYTHTGPVRMPMGMRGLTRMHTRERGPYGVIVPKSHEHALEGLYKASQRHMRSSGDMARWDSRTRLKCYMVGGVR